ncbi:MAG: nucleotide-binding protein, partial [Gallionellaceae bacterium]|nr:nucleotide-binding protein [Gallionellaceae bacterium]
ADDAIHVEKATGDNAYTVQEIVTKRAELKDKTVLVRGQVVKFNAQIMGKNWIHLQDGTGSDADESNDLLVTSQEAAKVGDVITAQGVVRVEQDFGSGYAYSVMLEGATLQK